MAADNSATSASDAAGTLQRLIHGYQFTQALHVAAQLDLPELVADGPQPATVLAERCGAHAPSLARLLRALTTLGVFAEVEPGVFGPTPLSQLLRAGVPGSRRAWLLASASEFYQTWGHLLHSVRTGETATRQAYGMESWAWRAQHLEENARFDDAMTELSARRVAALVANYDFSPFGTVTDIGGGRGALIAGILKANPGVRGILFDQPHVVAGTAALLISAGVSDRASIVPGDFFASVPAGSDLYVLSFVLHDWDDERAAAILARCRDAMVKYGTLLVFERVLSEGPDRPWDHYFADLNMLQGPGGRERTAEEWRMLLAAAGFALTRILPTPIGVSIIEAVPVTAQQEA
jgi:hypothetical protein